LEESIVDGILAFSMKSSNVRAGISLKAHSCGSKGKSRVSTNQLQIAADIGVVSISTAISKPKRSLSSPHSASSKAVDRSVRGPCP
jgi:hypothetical protein